MYDAVPSDGQMSKSTKRQEAGKKAGNGKSGGNGDARAASAGGKWFRTAEITLWLLVAGAFLFRFVPGAALGNVEEEGAAPGFTLQTLNGDELALKDLRGQVVLVNFWATWCPPCRLEIPGFQRVYEDYKDKGFTVLGLSTDEQGPGVVRAFVRDKGITYPVGMATDEMRRLYGGVDMLPQSFLLDQSGHVRKMVAGMFSEGMLRREIDTLLAEGKGQ